MNNKRFQKTEYEAQVIKVVSYNKKTISDGGKIIFKLDNDEIVTYHIKGINKQKSDISLKTAGYYLNNPYSYNQVYDFRKLLNRKCIVLIDLQISKYDDTKLVPVIINFKFSYKDLFTYNGENHA